MLRRRVAKLAKPLRLTPLGDAAVYAEWSESLDLEVNRALQAVALALRERAPGWVRDVVPALAGVALHFDLDHAELPPSPLAAASALIEEALKNARGAPASRVLEIPVCYAMEYGPDLAALAERTGLTPQEIARRHVATEHRVLMVGFAPGQPYIGGLDATLAVPRRATPRTRVPPGSVAIANAQTTVYPFEIAGGWHVIGRTPLTAFDARRAMPALFAAGDRVRFVAVSRAEFERLA